MGKVFLLVAFPPLMPSFNICCDKNLRSGHGSADERIAMEENARQKKERKKEENIAFAEENLGFGFRQCLPTNCKIRPHPQLAYLLLLVTQVVSMSCK